MNTKQQKQAVARINDSLHALTLNQYFASLPVGEIKAVIEAQGFDASALDGIYCGHSGREYGMALPVRGAHEAVPARHFALISWYKMPSGRYEVVSYVS